MAVVHHSGNSNDRLASSTSAFITLFKAQFGAAILALPNIIGEVGLILGIACYCLVATGSAFTCYLLLRARELTESNILNESATNYLRVEEDALDKNELKTTNANDYESQHDCIEVQQEGNTNNSNCEGSNDLLLRGEIAESGRSTLVEPTEQTNGRGALSDGIEKYNTCVINPLFSWSNDTAPTLKHESSSRRQRTTHLVTYGDLSSLLLTPCMAYLTRWTIILLHILFSAGLVIAFTKNMSNALSWDGHDDDDDGRSSMSGRYILGALLFPVAAVIVQIPWLQDMYLISALGLVVYLAGVMGSTVLSASVSLENSSPTDLWEVKWSGIPTFIGSATYALEGVTLSLPTVHSMRDRGKAIPVVCSVILLYGSLAVTFAAIGYSGGLGGGPGTGRTREECDVVTDCITPHSLELVVQLSLCASLVLSMPVSLYPATEMLEVMLTDWHEQRKNNRMEEEEEDDILGNEIDDEQKERQMPLIEDRGTEHAYDHLDTPQPELASRGEYSQRKSWRLRVALAFIAVLLGSTTRSFTKYSSLVGSVALTLAGFVLPPLLYIRAMAKSRLVVSWPMRAALSVILFYGTTNMFVGGFSSIRGMIKTR